VPPGWLLLSLLVATAYGVLGLREAFSSPYVVQSDARQYVTWMERFSDPELFPHDFIADYFEAISPPGFRAFYWLFAQAGIDPIVLSKLLPLALGLITTVYAFALCLRLLPSPLAAFASTVILNQSLWMTDDLISATPRAFGYPLLLAFLYYLARGSLPGTVITISLEGLFYPQMAAISAGTLVLTLVRWQAGKPRLTDDRREYLRAASGVLAALLVVLLSVARTSSYGPSIDAAEARTEPVFLSDGRAQFFFGDPWDFWFTHERSGLMPQQFGPPLVWAGLLLPVLMLCRAYFPLARRVAGSARPLPQLVLASFGLFFLAHALLFKLYLPGRYTQHSLRIVLALAAGLSLAILFERCATLVLGAARIRRVSGRQGIAGGVALLLAGLVLAPSVPWLARGELPSTRYRRGEASAIYEFFAHQPKSTVVASVSDVADFIPPLARRSVVVSPKYALPYHVGYYREIQARARDLIRAQYSPNLRELHNVTRKYGVDFWLVRQAAFSVSYVRNSWMMDIKPEADDAIERLRRGTQPALARLMDHCALLSAGGLIVVQDSCILAAEPTDLGHLFSLAPGVSPSRRQPSGRR